jgi:hypothetical protein
MLTADEVGRSLSGSLKLLNRDAEGLTAFEVSIAAFWRSFAAILLTAPAFVVALAEDRVEQGLPLQDGLFASPVIVAHEALLALAGWVVFPLVMIAVVRRLGLGHRYVGYIIAWNWSTVLAAFVLAVPAGLHALGLATDGLALLFAFAFSIVLLHYRWFLAKAALGVSGGIAFLLVLLDLSVNELVAGAISSLV